MMKLHIFTIIVIGICIASSGMFLDVVGQARRGQPPFEGFPVPAVRRLCHAERLYRLHEIEQPVAQIRARGCEEVTMVHIENGYFLFSGTHVVTGE